ncbi:oligosaccharide flippase family protein [Clostridium sp. 1001275B_160808_H3]|uniref:lipopolysaccharide biosynthesis protein n=1 Tax=Clostridium sp. 1001275B_160808_H3 TaxID=2787110 RepID=UPI001898CC3F|nr:oligosaccharide flippase family protein [Clostridium sp. 1001275B_160808_H3]
MSGLFKKFIEFAIGNGLVMILGLVSTPIVSRMIEPYEKGRADIFITYTSLIVLILTMGLDQAYIRYFNEEKERGALLRRAVKVPIILSFCLGAILLIFYKQVSNYMVEETSFFLVFLFAFHSFVSIISNFAMINVRMKQKAKSYSMLGVINKVAFIIFIVSLFYVFRNNYMTLVLATVLGNLVMVIMAILIERKDWFSLEKGVEVRTSTKELIKYGTPFIFSMAITWVFQSIDRISIQLFSDYTQLGLYGGAMYIISILNTVQGAFTTFWVPVAYDKYHNNPEDRKFFSNINEIVSFFMLIIAIGLIATKDLLIIILGKKYEGAQFIFPFLVLMPIMYTISETTVLGINFKKKTKYHIYIAVASAIANIIGNLILVPHLGAKGAAISTGLAYVVFFVTRSYFGNKLYKVEVKYAKFFVSVISVYILATISSIYKFNNIILVFTILSTSVVLFMYKNVIKDIFTIIKSMLKGKNK